MFSGPKSPSINKPSRRRLLGTFVAAPLAACGSSDTSESRYGLNYSTFSDALGVAMGFKPPPSVSREEAAAIPYSSIGYRIGSSGQGLLVLASQTGQTLLWTSSSRVAIVTEGARITKTAGLTWNLGATNFHGVDPAEDFHAPFSGTTIRYLDFPDLTRFGIGVSSTFALVRPESIQVLGQNLETSLIVEDCVCEDFGWNFQNRYWVDNESKFVWRSEQFTHPKLDPLQIEVFRPPA